MKLFSHPLIGYDSQIEMIQILIQIVFQIENFVNEFWYEFTILN